MVRENDFPTHKITLNLAPADVRKDGTAFDLPMTVGIMAAERKLLAPGAMAWR